MANNYPNEMAQVVPYLYYEDAGAALDFMEKAFGFEICHAFRSKEGVVLTAKVRTGSGYFMVGPGMAPFGTRPVEDPEWCSAAMYVYVDDVDEQCERARVAGAVVRNEPADHFGGDKICVVTDPGGHRWIFAQMKEEPT
jgi:uncharacterized glyoxalase superfamily protein PhnB